MSKGNFTSFLEALGAFESGINPTQDYGAHDLDWLMLFDPSKGNVNRSDVDLTSATDLSNLQYHVHNTLGFLGKYQFGEPLLIDLGYYTPAVTGFYGTTATNEWQGTFTGKHDVNSKADFMTNVQELAIREAFTMNMGVIEKYLSQAGKTIDDFLGKQIPYVVQGVTHYAEVTLSGILASAHLQGPGGVALLLLNNIASSDEYGTNILSYMDKFGGFDSPFGSNGNDMLSGSDYSETFVGEGGNNTYVTGGGNDKIIVASNQGGQDVVKDFNIGHDVISLSNFAGVKFANLTVTNNAQGHADILLPGNHHVVLEGIAASAVNESMFVYGPYTLGWHGNTGDTHFTNFNPLHDILDFSYAFADNNLRVYEENGSTVIEVVGNNQRYVLDNIGLDELTMGNFVKGPLGFATMLANAGQINGGTAGNTGSNTDGNAGTDTGGNTQTGVNQGTAQGDVFAFTWNWSKHDVVNNFDVHNDKIDLQGFWTNYDSFKIYNNADGNAVIDLGDINNQTITLAGVSASSLTANNIKGVLGDFSHALGSHNAAPVVPVVPTVPVVPPVAPADPVVPSADAHVYSYTWNWGNDSVVNGFNHAKDVVDLSGFWTDFSKMKIYENSVGDTIIDLKDLNNQSIKLAGVHAADLNASNFKGVLGTLSQALTSSTPVSGSSGSSTSSGSSSSGSSTSTVPPHVIDAASGSTLFGTDGADVYKFTWAWGSQATIQGFDHNKDKIDLKSFWTSPDKVSIHNDAQGNAVIDLTNLNNQTIKVAGVSADQIHPDNILF